MHCDVVFEILNPNFRASTPMNCTVVLRIWFPRKMRLVREENLGFNQVTRASCDGWRFCEMTCWHVDMLTCWHVDLLTCWLFYLLTCWLVDRNWNIKVYLFHPEVCRHYLVLQILKEGTLERGSNRTLKKTKSCYHFLRNEVGTFLVFFCARVLRQCRTNPTFLDK